MKFRVGKHVVGQVPDGAVAAHKGKPKMDHRKVEALILQAICNQIRAYRHLPGAKEQFSRALGISKATRKQ